MRSAFEAQQHFVADAAHELRSPLAALKLQVQGLRRAPDDAARQQAVARLDAGLDRATRLVEQLLVLARQEASAAAVSPLVAVDCDALVRQALADAAPGAQARGIDLGLAPACAANGTGGWAAGLPEALRILLRNLLDNAVKYTPAGGRIDAGWRAVPGGVELWVEDSGPGIPAAERARVLGRFYRGPESAQSTQGSGLGLAIVQAIARRHGTALTLEDAPHLGGLRAALILQAWAGSVDPHGRDTRLAPESV